MTTFPKGTTVDTGNLQPGELIHMEFDFYNVTSIRGFTSMLTVVCANTRILWVLPTASKLAPVRIIRFILTTLLDEQHPFKHIIVDEDSALAKSTDVTNLLVEKFKISMENTGGNASWINGNNERHNRSIQNIVRAGLLDSTEQEKNGAVQQRHQQKSIDAKSTVD